MAFLNTLEIRTRAVTLLRENGITDEEALRRLTRDEFMRWKGAGNSYWAEIEGAKPPAFTDGMRAREYMPAGHHACSAPLRQTEKGVLASWRGETLWFSKSAVDLVDGRVTASLETIGVARNFTAQVKNLRAEQRERSRTEREPGPEAAGPGPK